MSISSQKKSLWVSLVGLLVAFGGYFHSALATVLPTPQAKDVLPHQTGLLIAATAFLIVILLLDHTVIALLDRHTERDERDKLIELRGGRYGAVVLSIGVFFALCAAPLTEGNAVMAYVLLGSWVVAQAVEIVSQLFMHRRDERSAIRASDTQSQRRTRA